MFRFDRSGVVALAACLAAGFGLAACGSSSSSSSTASTSPSGASSGADASVVALAKTAVAKAAAPVTEFNGPKSSPPIAKNKTIYVIACNTDTAACARQPAGAQAAGKAMGWTVKKVDTDGSYPEFVNAMNQAIDAKADGIILVAAPLAVVSQPLARAKAAGIPVVFIQNGSRTPKMADWKQFDGGFYAVVGENSPEVGAIAADKIIADSGGHAVVGVFHVFGYPEVQAHLDEFVATLAKCKTCKLVKPVVNVPVTSLAKDAASAVAAKVRANPDINYFYSTFDGGAVFVAQGLRAAGKHIPLVSNDGDAANLQMVTGDGPQVADVADPLEWMGWGAMDELNRAFNKQAPAPEWLNTGTGIPIKLLTKANAPTNGQPFTGDIDYGAAFKKLWGIGQ